jgi:2-polyprenyl-3-methyl-5-hydroxy-6-metoxy-1,4-benzoquinol methylase
MDQRELVQQVLDDLPNVPEVPSEGHYLTLAEAEAIVDETIAHVRRTGAAREYVYLNGHRRRLAVSLTMIPKAETPDASCLDIGCYGYMAFWAWRHLGYHRVVGIEMRPGEASLTTRTVEMDDDRLMFEVHNFDIANQDWPLDGTFDTILFFETLAHVDRDPSSVVLNVTRRMSLESTLVISVPNAVSYKTLQEFMTGAPPWTYWFFHPDLEHESRHSFEYTPIFLKIVLRSAGLAECAFRTICAYVEPDTINHIFEIGSALAVEPRMFGETMIVQARKVAEEPLFRYPDCIYDGDRYYRSTYPLLRDRLEQAHRAFLETHRIAAEQVAEAKAQQQRAESQAREAAARAAEALFLCNQYLAKLQATESALQRAPHMRAKRAFWRATGPARRLFSRFPTTSVRVQGILLPLARSLRRLVHSLRRAVPII